MSFAEAEAFTLSKEGGYYPGNLASDPNETFKGITGKTYHRFRLQWGLPKQNVVLMSEAERTMIYRAYWDDARCELVGHRTGMAMFDHSLNAGPGEAIKCLQRAIGVDDDGKVGPKTKAALAGWEDIDLFEGVQWRRLQYYRDLARQPKHRPSLLSWLSRVVDLTLG